MDVGARSSDSGPHVLGQGTESGVTGSFGGSLKPGTERGYVPELAGTQGQYFIAKDKVGVVNKPRSQSDSQNKSVQGDLWCWLIVHGVRGQTRQPVC